MSLRTIWAITALLSGALWGASQIAPQPIAAQGQPMTGRERFAVDVLAQLGNAEPSRQTIAFVVAWQGAEGTAARFNPLATTQDWPGATCFNSVCVRNYQTYEDGIQATLKTLANGFYPRTLAGLQTNEPILDDDELRTWGTGAGNVGALWTDRP